MQQKEKKKANTKVLIDHTQFWLLALLFYFQNMLLYFGYKIIPIMLSLGYEVMPNTGCSLKTLFGQTV